MQTGYKVLDIMTNKPVAANGDMSLRDAAKLLESQDVNSLILVNNGKPIGIVTDEDIVRKCVAKGLDSNKVKLKDIACMELIVITPEKDLFDALSLMSECRIRQLPVTENGLLVGILTLTDALKIQPDLINMWMEQFELMEGKNRQKEIDDIENDDGSGSFFSKLTLKKSSKKKNPAKKNSRT